MPDLPSGKLAQQYEHGKELCAGGFEEIGWIILALPTDVCSKSISIQEAYNA